MDFSPTCEFPSSSTKVRMPNDSGIPDLFIPVFGLGFAIDCSSYVSVRLSFRTTTISPHQALIEGAAASIAIWDRNKIAVALAISTWGINVAFLIEGMSFSLPPYYCRSCVIMQTCFGNRSCAGEPRFHQYSISIIHFWTSPHLRLVHRCAPYGYWPS